MSSLEINFLENTQLSTLELEFTISIHGTFKSQKSLLYHLNKQVIWLIMSFIKGETKYDKS